MISIFRGMFVICKELSGIHAAGWRVAIPPVNRGGVFSWIAIYDSLYKRSFFR